jgi:hypothetical protein
MVWRWNEILHVKQLTPCLSTEELGSWAVIVSILNGRKGTNWWRDKQRWLYLIRVVMKSFTKRFHSSSHTMRRSQASQRWGDENVLGYRNSECKGPEVWDRADVSAKLKGECVRAAME